MAHHALYGFVEAPDLIESVKAAPGLPATMDLDKAVFFATRDTITPATHSALSKTRIAEFSYLFRNAARPIDRFNLPPECTVEVARQVRS